MTYYPVDLGLYPIADARRAEALPPRSFTKEWTDTGIALLFSEVRENADHALSGNLTIWYREEVLHTGRMVLTSLRARDETVRWLGRLCAKQVITNVPWEEYLEQLATLVRAKRAAASAAMVRLDPQLIDPDQQFIVEPTILTGAPNIFYGSGGTGKGYMALAHAIVVGTNHEVAGLVAQQTGPVLYLDWEAGQQAAEHRLARLGAGLGLPPSALKDRILYQRMRRPLLEELDAVQLAGDREGVILVVIDSLAMACGGEPETAASAIPTMGAIESLGTSLIVAHVSKADAAAGGTGQRPYGSVFVENLARSTWLVQAKQEGLLTYTTLTHRKANDLPILPPIGFTLDFRVETAVSISRRDVTEQAEDGLTLAEQIIAALSQAPATSTTLASDLNADLDTVRRTLRRLEKRKKTTQRGGGGGKEAVWNIHHSDKLTDTLADTGGHS